MKITDYIRSIFTRSYHVLKQGEYTYADINCGREPFGKAIYLNITQLLTDIYSEVIWSAKADTNMWRAWKAFVDRNGQRILSSLLVKDGYAVIGYRIEGEGWVFWQMREKEYLKRTNSDGDVLIEPKDKSILFYVLKSPTFEETGKSDFAICAPFIKYLDNALNASNTICERLGVFVIVSPKMPAGMGMVTSLNEKQKKDLEETVQKEYGALKKQNQIMLLPNEVNANTINLAGLDLKTSERVRMAILAICDRIKVPANQVAIIDAGASKSLSNGTELREGDLAKYRSFRRLLNSTWFDMATEIGLQVDYTIENEPKTVQGQTIEMQTI